MDEGAPLDRDCGRLPSSRGAWLFQRPRQSSLIVRREEMAMQNQPTSIKPTVFAFGSVSLFATGLAAGVLVSRYLPIATPQSLPAGLTASGSTPEDKFLATANTKQAEHGNFLKGKDAAFSDFKATMRG